MNWSELTHLPWAFLGWFIFIVDQWEMAKRLKGDQFNWGIFIGRNLPSFLFNFLAMVALAGIAAGSGLEVSIAESIGMGYLGSQIFKNRYKKNGTKTTP
jgi:hypothetical protein